MIYFVKSFACFILAYVIVITPLVLYSLAISFHCNVLFLISGIVLAGQSVFISERIEQYFGLDD